MISEAVDFSAFTPEKKETTPSFTVKPVNKPFFKSPAPKKTRKAKPKPVPTQSIQEDDHTEELKQMSININDIMENEPQEPIPTPRPVKKKKQLSEKQLAHLARMREAKLAKSRARKAQQPTTPTPKQVQRSYMKPEKTPDYYAKKKANRQKEFTDLFNSLYDQRMTARENAKAGKRAQKQKLYNQLQTELGNLQKRATKPKPKPKPVQNLGAPVEFGSSIRINQFGQLERY